MVAQFSTGILAHFSISIYSSYSKEVPIVALTAFAFESDKDRAIEAGCDDFLTKPVSQNALEKVLDKYVK